MKRNLLAIAMLLGAIVAPSRALAQTVFFDDFDGDALLPHWGTPAPSAWEYNVSNSMLNVTGLFSPSNPKSPGNFAGMSAPFTPLTDFQMDVYMGWEAGEAPHRLEVQILGPFGANPILARMGYRNDAAFGPVPLIYGSASGQSISIPAPEPDIHHFTISRIGSTFNLYFNDLPVASIQDDFGISAAYVGFFFVGPYPGELGAFHIDRVQVIPAPATLLLFSASVVLGSARRRKR